MSGGGRADLVSLEAHMALAKKGIRARKVSRPAALSARYADALEELARVERQLSRVSARWLKVRAKVRRYERELDKLTAADGA